MHLSLLSDSFVSDSLEDDAAPIFMRSRDGDASLHLQGLIRGVLFACALAVPLLLTVGAAWWHHGESWIGQTGTIEGSQTDGN